MRLNYLFTLDFRQQQHVMHEYYKELDSQSCHAHTERECAYGPHSLIFIFGCAHCDNTVYIDTEKRTMFKLRSKRQL